jgi:hypothetical protein
MGNMPDITRNIMTIRPRHLTPIFLKSPFPWQKWPFKAPKRPLFYTFFFHFRCLAWSDPAPQGLPPLTVRIIIEGFEQRPPRQFTTSPSTIQADVSIAGG